MDLVARIDAWGERVPHAIAHRSPDGELSWAELVRRSNALAGGLAKAGLSATSPVVLHGHKESEMLVGFLACLKAGHPYVPIDTGTPAARATAIVAASGAELVLTPERIRELEAPHHARPAIAEPPNGCAAPVYVMFTSGSTGEPKGVVITRSCLEAFLGWMLGEQRFAPGERFLNQALFSFDLSIMDTWSSLVTGGTLVSLGAAETADFGRLYAALAASDVTTWVSTPPFAQLCLADRRFGPSTLPNVRRFLFCGDVLTPDVAAQLLERFPDAAVWNTYGPTEATVATTSVRIDRALVRRYAQLPIGRAMRGTSVVVEDEAGVALGNGERGEIVVVGPNVSPGYLGRPDLTARVFSSRDGVRAYRTGDWGVYDDGLLFFHGRMDDQVKIAGHRIELGDVESHLAALPTVVSAAVVASRRDGRPEALHAFVVLVSRPAESDLQVGAALRDALAASLPTYMLPRRFHVVDRFPLTANGKTDRAALAAMANA